MHEPEKLSTKELLDQIAKMTFGITVTDAVQEGICIFCVKPAKSFSTGEFKKIYETSGMCQPCQEEEC